MNEYEIKLKLDQLADLHAKVDALELQKIALIDTVMTPEIRAKLADIHDEFAPKLEAANVAAGALEAEVKQAVLALGSSVKGSFIHAVWMKGRTSWDTKGLAGYAVAHPEINTFFTVGEPSVSLRVVK